MSKDNTNQLMNVVYIIGAAFIIIALSVFLAGKNDKGHSGFQILAHAGFWYIFEMILFSLFAATCIVYGIARYRVTQDWKKTLPIILVAVVFISIAFGKACTDKSNDGVTSPGGRPGGAAPVDSSRVPAEDLLPKKDTAVIGFNNMSFYEDLASPVKMRFVLNSVDGMFYPMYFIEVGNCFHRVQLTGESVDNDFKRAIYMMGGKLLKTETVRIK